MEIRVKKTNKNLRQVYVDDKLFFSCRDLLLIHVISGLCVFQNKNLTSKKFTSITFSDFLYLDDIEIKIVRDRDSEFLIWY